MTAKPVGPYTPVVRAGDWLIVSGQVGLADGKLVSGGLEGELRQALTNLRGHLEANGASMSNVAKTTVFLKHMSDYALMNEVYISEFGDHRPARSAIGVADLPVGALVEVEASSGRPPESSKGVPAMTTGTVKFFNSEKGWGFIAPDEGGDELFVHYKNIQGNGFRTLEQGQKVEFTSEQTDRGLQAKDVKLV